VEQYLPYLIGLGAVIGLAGVVSALYERRQARRQ
jgi:hypothetical protein